jgi:hypothetical protein
MKIVIRGIVKNTSALLTLAEAEVLEGATLEEIDEGADQIRDIIKTSFRDKSAAFITIEGVVINVSEFAILSVKVEK